MPRGILAIVITLLVLASLPTEAWAAGGKNLEDSRIEERRFNSKDE